MDALKPLVDGTTSACAENTLRVIHGLRSVGNYLRVRGEYQAAKVELWRQYGTTSACAENTGSHRILASRTRNYLRVRGEYPHSCYVPTESEELPPRARRIHRGLHGFAT